MSRTSFPLDPLSRAIDRQLSQRDRRPLETRSHYLTRGASLTWDHQDVSDNGFNARIIEEAIDLVLIRGKDAEPSGQ